MTAAEHGTDAVIGIDIGGTSVAIDVVALDGRSLFTTTYPTGQGEAAVASLLSRLSVALDAARLAGVAVRAVGLLSPGHLDDDRGLVRFASNLGWRELPLRERVATVLPAGTPVALGHDVRWAGIAEGALGAAQGVDDYVVVSIGTGIAACLVSGGRVLTGAEGSAGEFGHATAVPGGDRCACGRIGCVDAYASGAALVRRYRELGGQAPLSGAFSLLESRSRDALARRVWDDGVDALAAGLCTLTLTLDPSVIIVAGGLSGAGEALIDPLRSRLEQQLGWKRCPQLLISPLGTSTGRAGAVLLALRTGGVGDRAAGWDAQTVHRWRPAAERAAVSV